MMRSHHAALWTSVADHSLWNTGKVLSNLLDAIRHHLMHPSVTGGESCRLIVGPTLVFRLHYSRRL